MMKWGWVVILKSSKALKVKEFRTSPMQLLVQASDLCKHVQTGYFKPDAENMIIQMVLIRTNILINTKYSAKAFTTFD